MIPNEWLYALAGLGLTLLATKMGLPLKAKAAPTTIPSVEQLRDLIRQILWEVLQTPQPPSSPPLTPPISNEQLRQKLMEWKQ